jgi:hypothetical protein
MVHAHVTRKLMVVAGPDGGCEGVQYRLDYFLPVTTHTFVFTDLLRRSFFNQIHSIPTSDELNWTQLNQGERRQLA